MRLDGRDEEDENIPLPDTNLATWMQVFLQRSFLFDVGPYQWALARPYHGSFIWS
jgi:hypothetical protein